MSNWGPGTVYSDYAPIPAKMDKKERPDIGVAGLQVESGRDPKDMRGRDRYAEQKQQELRSGAPNPPPRIAHTDAFEAARGGAQQQLEFMSQQLEFMSIGGGSDDLSPQQLMEAANNWAKRNAFSPEQLQEFGHLITMVAATYIPRSQITGFRQLDQGSFGMIYSAAYDGSSVAVKQCSSDGSQIKGKMRELLLELSVLVRIRHPNIVTFWGTAADFPLAPGKPYIGMVFELCSLGSLYKSLHQVAQKGGKRLGFKEKMKYALEVARGMSYIHAKGIIHRDLNSRNILLTDQGHAKVADFGCARKLKGIALQTTTISGSPAYMAPEQLDGADLTDKIDVWAFGILMWEIVCEQVPWASKGNSLEALKRAVCSQGERLPLPTADRFPQGWRAQYIKMMEMTWNKNPAARPSMADMARGLEALCNQDPSGGAMVGEFM
mmetsp:Transcript_33466/g.53893  ORF Transcript_33466/g.53893 Transcript_33466/m.53893 type:complete len:436 (-) Transcript_33466:293-1600(-)|eukprot:CAMPEP_0179429278 /NCGR_PEP_ID=MMETSP0799-20121207/14702_1 /TAXON_ID=46947 /ORGANISM="Geminigera cryophila, Strain CCMP2564" /LENGTH=435 /DNA_ID=CAMNT_0021205117 /DNA_START=95 /DNA_END=1402 /DNA_ORIENTATION=+